MITIGVPKEIKNNENRVALTPVGAKILIQAGHGVMVEHGAGEGSGFSDSSYGDVGCEIVRVETAWNTDLVLKVKEPQASEYHFLKQQILFAYFHLAGVTSALTDALLEAGTTALAYETLRDDQGRLPLLAPMSAVAGNMAVTIGSYYLAKFNQGKGVQLGSVLGKRHGSVVVLGDGVVGRHAARVADHIGAKVTMFTRHSDREAELKGQISDRLRVALSTPEMISEVLPNTDLLVGAVLHSGSRTPHLVTDEMVASMESGSVIVDVSIDQGGCVETAHPTTHGEPIYVTHGVTHYCVTNMPGAYPRTSTIALTNETLAYILRLAEGGLDALRHDQA
ncbi:MAG: alanine dehydrogenase, partial [Porticoccus sp.]